MGKGLGKKLLSLFMALALALTTLAVPGSWGGIEAYAATKSNTVRRLYLKLPTGTSAGDWAANCWGDSTASVSGATNVRIGGTWGDQQKPSLLAGAPGWAYVDVSGNVTGFQFVKWIIDATDTSTAPTVYDCWDSQIAALDLTEAYYDPAKGKWYKESSCTNEITPPAPAVTSTNLTIHFQNSKNWNKVYSKFGSGGSWSAISGLEYCSNDMGGIIKENEKNAGWYSYKIVKQGGDTVNGLFNNGSWGGDNQTGNFSIPITAETMEVWITYGSGTAINVSSNKPSGWTSGATVSAPVNPADLSAVKSPVINDDGSVTFNYEISAAKLGGNKLCLMGTLTDWDNGKEMTDADGDGVYSITIPDVKPGKYQYKFKYGNTWVTDPANTEQESGNSLLVVEGFLIDCENLAGTGNFDVNAVVTDSVNKDSIVWSIKNRPAGISIEKKADDPTKAVITTTDDAVNGNYTVVANYTDTKGKSQQAEQTVYYTRKAYLYEYEYKSGSKYKGQSDIYTWSNSLAGNTGVKFHEVNGKNIAYITLDDTTTDFGYIVRLPGKWEASESDDREFTDRTLTAYADDRYTKVKGGEGIEVPYLLPSGKTYYDGGIVFAWRDDNRFYNNTMGELSGETVQVVIQDNEGTTTKTENMTYSAKDELFTYKWTNVEDGTYKFYFMVDGTKVEDQYWGGKIEYKKPVLDITAKVSPEAVNYNQNPVVSFTIKDRDTGKDIEVAAITADLTNLGYSGQKVEFQPVSKEGVLYIDRSVAAGTYQVPFTITDLYGNKTEINVDVQVTEKTDSEPSWDESRIYFLLTDRFVDGDTSNNYNVNKAKIESYHGGDFKGLTSKLGYLQDLGINTIWITPIVDNIDNVVNVDLNQYGYHGYWAKDFTKTDEHLGNTADLDKLIDEAEKRGIKVMVDIVVNHAGYGMENSSNFAGMIRPKEEAVESDFILQWQGDLPDFKTEEEAIRAKLIAWQTAWVNHTTPSGNRIAYFRVDTVKHVEHDTWQDLKTSLASVNPAFKMIGEYYGAGVSNTGDYLGNGQMDALLDFDFKGTARSFVNGNIDSVESTLENRNARLSNSFTMGQFLGSHDEDGFLYSVGNDTSKMKVAAALQITAKGIPIVYYGEEINLTGPNDFGNQNNNRYDMQFDNLTDDQTAMLNHYKKLLAARAMYSNIFATGTRAKVTGSDSSGYLVFKRSAGGKNVYVGLNTTDAEKQVTFNVSETGLTNVYSGEDVNVSGGSVTVKIPASSDGGTVILAEGRTLTGVSFQGPAKTSYYVGEELNTDGITVTGIYDSTVKVPISTGYTVDDSEYDKTKTGTYTITVTYGDYSQEFQVTVSERPQSSGGSSDSTASDVQVTVHPDGSVTETRTWNTQNEAGNEVSNTMITEKDAQDKITESRKISVIADAVGTITVTVVKDAGDKITSAGAEVTIAGKQGKTNITGTIPGSAVSQITSAAGTTDADITVTVLADKKSYTVTVNAANLTAGTELVVVAVDKKTGKYVLVNAKTYKVIADGSVKLALPAGANYELVTEKQAAKIEKEILKTVKLKNSSVTIKNGKSKKVQLSSKLDMQNVSKITYTSSKKSVATVSSKGKIKAKKAGTVTIKVKVTLKNGTTKTLKLKVKVK